MIASTLSNTADKHLRENFAADIVIIDEAGQAKELEALLPILHNLNSIKLIIFVGDPKQLPSTVLSRLMEVDSRPANVFAAQTGYALFQRMYDNDSPVFLFTEQHRMASQLSEASSKLYYGSKIVNNPFTALENRPSAQRAVRFIQEEFGLQTTTPHIVLDVKDGICMRSTTQSRSNLQSVVATWQYIELVVEKGVHKPEEIVIVTLTETRPASTETPESQQRRQNFGRKGTSNLSRSKP